METTSEMVEQGGEREHRHGRRHAQHSYNEADLLRRLRRIEGQVRGVQRMVEEGRYCLDIVTQLQAVQAAADKVAQEVLEQHIRGCVTDAIKEENGDAAIEELMSVLGKAMRR